MNAQEHADEKTTWLVQRLAEKTSRRGLLARVGRWALVVMGVAAVEALPIGPARTTEASSDCGYWVNCGMHGFPCECCGGSTDTCPPGYGSANAWVICCCDPASGFQLCYNVTYQDCCYNDPSGQCCSGDPPNGNPSCCPSCQFCANWSQPSWCGGYTCYKCTTTLVGTYC